MLNRFMGAHHDLIFLISSYLSAEDIFVFSYYIEVEAQYADIMMAATKEANFFWKKKFIEYFPHETAALAKKTNVHWQTEFFKKRRVCFKGLQARPRKLFTLLREGELDALLRESFLPKDLILPDKYGYSLLSLAKYKNNQQLLDRFYADINRYFEKNMFAYAEEEQEGRDTFYWTIKCRQPVDTFNEKLKSQAHYIEHYRELHPWAIYHPLFPALFLAAEDGLHPIVISILARREAKIHDNDLCVAALNGHYDIAASLINSGANVNARCTINQCRDETALYLAAQNGHVKIVQLLLQEGADVNLLAKHTDVMNGSALHIAVCNAQHDVLKLLLNHPETDINIETSFGLTALLLAVGRRDRVSVNLLLDKKADLSKGMFNTDAIVGGIVFKKGSHVFHAAAALGDLIIIKSLFDSSSNRLLVANDCGEMPVDIAHPNVKTELKLLTYLLKREKQGNFIYSFNFFRHEIVIDFTKPCTRAFSKEEKLSAARATIAHVFHSVEDNQLQDQHWAALHQGNLGHIFTELIKKYDFLYLFSKNKPAHCRALKLSP